MQRRHFLKTATAGALAGAGVTAAPWVHAQEPRLRWRMATSWPESLEPLFGGASHFCQRVGELTDGRFEIRAYAGGELVGGLQVLDAVRSGTAEAGHTASYYYTGTAQSLAFDTAVPFGMTARMQNAWLYQGGGSELMNERVFRPLGIVAFPAGNTGTQMGGWFREEVPDLDSLQGLRMRIPGLGGEIMERLGVSVQNLAAAEIYPALERGVIDATEFVGPWDDERLGFWEVAKNYYYPSWWEPGAMVSVYVNAESYDALPERYRQAITAAAAETNVRITSDYDQRNPPAVRRLRENGVRFRAFSDEIMAAAEREAYALYEELSEEDEQWREIYGEWKAFRDLQYEWFGLAEQGYARFAFGRGEGGG